MRTYLIFLTICLPALAATDILDFESAFIHPVSWIARPSNHRHFGFVGSRHTPAAARITAPRSTITPQGADINEDLFPRNCGTSFQRRIVGGSYADLGQYPWMALLKYEQRGTGSLIYDCAGSLINKRYVVTAAHCVMESLKGVRLGEHNMGTKVDCDEEGYCLPQAIDVSLEEKIVYPKYTKKKKVGDLALLRLDRDVEFSNAIRPICLPNPGMMKEDDLGRRLVVAGWGLTSSRGRASPIKKFVEIPVVSPAICARIYRGVFHESGDYQICAGGEEGRDSCNKDSGGPLMDTENTRAYLRGIVSFGGVRCGVRERPAVYTRISKYMSWIKNNVRH